MAASRQDGQGRTVRVVYAEGTGAAAVTVKPAGPAESTDAGQEPRCASPSCGRPLERQATGRPARYCSGRCRQAVHRARARAAAAAAAEFRDADAAPAVTKPPERVPGAAGRSLTPAWDARQRDMRRPIADQLRSNRQGLLRRAARDLLRMLDQVAGPDEPETRETLRDVAAAVDLRRDSWPPG
jgi:hypothetical protein